MEENYGFGSLNLETEDAGSKVFNQTCNEYKVGKMEKYVHLFYNDSRLANVHFSISYIGKGYIVGITNHSKNIIKVGETEVAKNKVLLLKDLDVIDLLDKNGKTIVKFTYRSRKNALKRANPETKLDDDPKQSGENSQDGYSAKKQKESYLKAKTDKFFANIKDDEEQEGPISTNKEYEAHEEKKTEAKKDVGTEDMAIGDNEVDNKEKEEPNTFYKKLFKSKFSR